MSMDGYFVALSLCKHAMERPGELQFHLCVRGYHVYKDGSLQYKMNYSLANGEKEIHTIHLQLGNAAITALHHFLNLLH